MIEIGQAVSKLAALAQETRLRIFRLLVEAGDEGLNASAIAEALDLPPATLSFHVAHLARAELVQSRQESRFIFYSVSYEAMDDLIAYLAQNCCKGQACLPKTAAINSIEKRRRLAKKNN
jgi:ArsR family transcriptional regulator, arsenate/arsenite/antimonite-responsive transcriptional repressor